MDFYFPRPALARSMANALLAQQEYLVGANPIIRNPGAGVFLSEKRRIGKTAFLRAELLPELIRGGVATVYIDLWEDRRANPEQALLMAIQSCLHQELGLLGKTRESFKSISKFSIPAFLSLDFAKDKATPTLTALLSAWHDMRKNAKKNARIVIIIDEAQHALESEAGEAMMFSLKAARDALNLGSQTGPNLLLIFTGSHRSKLNALLSNKNAPFFGCQIAEFPALDQSYTSALTLHINSKLKKAYQFEQDAMWQVFEALEKRPEELRSIIEKVLFAVNDQPSKNPDSGLPSAAALSLGFARARKDEQMHELLSTYNSLPITQRAVLFELIRAKNNFSPYSAQALASYKATSGSKTFSPSTAQTALDALVSQGIVWKPMRGGYQLDDPAWELFAAWQATKRLPTRKL